MRALSDHVPVGVRLDAVQARLLGQCVGWRAYSFVPCPFKVPRWRPPAQIAMTHVEGRMVFAVTDEFHLLPGTRQA